MNAAYALLDDPQSWAAFSKPFNSVPSLDAASSATWESQVVVLR